MYILLRQGRKGLVYSDGNRCYFPDRSWGPATEGFFEGLKVKVDKDTYAFITGKMIKLLPLSKEEFFSVNKYDCSKCYKVMETNGGTAFIVIFSDNSLNIYGKTEKGIELLAFTGKDEAEYSERCNAVIRDFVSKASMLDVRAENRAYLLKSAVIPDKERLMVACIRILGSRHYSDFSEFVLYDDTVIKAVRKKSSGVSVSFGDTYVFTEDDVLHPLDNADCGKVTMRLSMDEVADFMLKHKISRKQGFVSCECPNKRVIVHSVLAFDDEGDMYAWSAENFTMDCLDDKDACEFLERKHKELEIKVKNLARCCPKSEYSKLRYISFKRWAVLPTSIV